jgi:AraC-like DNA-binding protein
MPLATALLLAGLAQAIFLGLFLLWHRRGPIRANRLMGLLLLCLAASISVPMLYEFDRWASAPHLVLVFSNSTFLIGPLLLWYVRLMTEPGFRFRGFWWVHLLPALINLTAVVPALTLEPALLTNALINPTVDPRIASLIPTLKMISVIAYSVWCLLKLKRHRQRLAQAIANLEHRNLRWLTLLILACFFCVVILALLFMFAETLGIATATLDSLFAGGLTVVVFMTGWMSLQQPEIFSGPLADVLPESASPRSLKLSESQLAGYRELLKSAEQEGRFYLDRDITAQSLARQIGVPQHHLSFLLNAELGCNFFAYINSLRIQEVKRLLRDDHHAGETILDIALNCGFNNKATFNKAFREHSGTTPSQYRRENSGK